jgi:hypothetical protein
LILINQLIFYDNNMVHEINVYPHIYPKWNHFQSMKPYLQNQILSIYLSLY